MSEVRLRLPSLHPGQQQIAAEGSRFNVLACGRRWGKTTFCVDRLIHPALQGHPAAYFAPTYKMLVDVWRNLSDLMRPVAKRVNAQEHRIELVTGGVIEMWSLDAPDSARGHKYRSVVIDEAAMIADLENAWQAVIRPTLTDYAGDAWFPSTPKGINFFQTIYEWGQDRRNGEWISWRMPTRANPLIDPAEIESARLELPEQTFQQEYLAEFLANAGAVFRNIDGCCTVTAPDPDLKEHEHHNLVMGVDWAKQEDFTVLTVGCRECHAIVDWDRFNQIDYAFQRGRLAALAAKWHVSHILAESNSIGEPNIEMLQREGLPVRGFETTATTKPPLIESLALALERNELAAPKDYAGELRAYEMQRNEHTGRPRYGAPEGLHDDRVMSLALAWHAIENARLQIY